jgi:hypothetical protein
MIDLEISHCERVVIVTAKGTLNAADFDLAVSKKLEGHAISYGQLFDVRGARVELSASDLMMNAGRVAAYGQEEVVGAVAFLVDQATDADARVIASLAAAPRPFRIFRDQRKALAWLRGRQSAGPTHLP